MFFNFACKPLIISYFLEFISTLSTADRINQRINRSLNFLQTMAGVLILVSHESGMVGERQRGGEVGG